MAKSTRTVRLWLLRTSAKARCYSKIPPERHPGPHDEIWIATSVIEHSTNHPNGECEVTLPEWLLEKEGL